MKSVWIGAAGVLAGLVAVGVLLGREMGLLGGGAVAAPPDGPPVGWIASVRGSVNLRKTGAVNWEPASVGTPLHPQDRIQTLEGGRASIDLMAGRSLALGENSLVLMSRAPRSSAVRLESGSVDVTAIDGRTGGVVIETPSGTIHVGSRSVDFRWQPGPMPTGTTERLAQEIAYARRQLSMPSFTDETRRRCAPHIDEAERSLAAQRVDDARRALDGFLSVLREARPRDGVVISVNEGENGARGVYALSGEASVEAGLTTHALSEGSGLQISTPNGPAQQRRLLPSPTPSEPAMSATLYNQPRPTFRWSPIEQASAYLVEVARDEAFAQLVMETRATSPTHLAAEGLSDGTYYWRVRAVDSESAFGRISDAGVFTLKTDRDPPSLKLDADPVWGK